MGRRRVSKRAMRRRAYYWKLTSDSPYVLDHHITADFIPKHEAGIIGKIAPGVYLHDLVHRVELEPKDGVVTIWGPSTPGLNVTVNGEPR